MLHGFASSIYTWKDEIPALARDHEVVALDLPGFGWSDQPADLSFALYPRVVVGLLDELGLARASLVGNSLGGATSVDVAVHHPERVLSLVLHQDPRSLVIQDNPMHRRLQRPRSHDVLQNSHRARSSRL